MQGNVTAIEVNPFASYRDRLKSRLVPDYIPPVLPVADDGGKHGLAAQLRFEELVDRLADCRSETLIVSGMAGIGKTSLVTHVAVALLDRQAACLRIPIDHLANIDKGTSVREVLLRLNPGVDKDLWKSRVKKGRCILLIDALNEVEQRFGSDWPWNFIRNLLDGPDNITILATTRYEPEGLGESDLRNVHRLRLEGFTESEQAQYLGVRGLELEPAIHRIDAAGLGGIAANPLLLALVCGLLIEQPDQSLPRNRVGVFKSTLDMATKRLSHTERAQSEIGLTLPAVFAAASHCAQLDPAGLFRRPDVVNLCRRVWTEQTATPDALLSALIETHLIERLPSTDGPANYRFLHDSLTDFGLALAIAVLSRPPDYLFTEPVPSQTLGNWVGLRPATDDAAQIAITLALQHQRYDLLVDTAIANAGILSDESASAIWTAAGQAFTKGRSVRDRMAETLAKLPPIIRRQAIAGGLLRRMNIEQPDFAMRLRELIMDRSFSALALQRLWSEFKRTSEGTKRRSLRPSSDAVDTAQAANVLHLLVSGRTVQERRSAALTLGDIGRRENIPALVRVLENDTEPSVRGAAANALGRMGDRQAVPALSAALADPRIADNIRGSAANALGQIGDRQAVPALSAALADPKIADNIRGSAANALGQIGDRQAVAALSAALADPKIADNIRGSAANALGKIGDRQAVAALSAALENPDVADNIRGSAANALGQIGDRQAVAALSAALENPDVADNIRGSAANALGQIGDRQAVAVLSLALTDPKLEDSIRGSAAKALGQIGDRQAVPALSAAVADRTLNDIGRGSAANALGQIGDRQAVPALSAALADLTLDEIGRSSAANALGKIGDRQAVAVLSLALTDPKLEDSIRGSAAKALGQIGDRQAVPALSAAVADRTLNDIGRGSAANALGQIGDARASSLLRTTAADGTLDSWVRNSAFSAALRLASTVEDWALQLANPSAPAAIRGRLITALRHGDTTVHVTDWLRRTVRRDPDNRNRTEAVPALERHGLLDDETIQFLIDPAYPRPDGRRWDTENGVRGQVAATVLSRLLKGRAVSRPVLEAIARMLDDQKTWSSVIQAALAPLFVAESNAAARVLSNLKALLPAPPTNPYLNSRLMRVEDDISTRRTARQALERIKTHPEDVIMSFRPRPMLDTSERIAERLPTVLLVTAVSQETKAIRTELMDSLHIEPNSELAGHRIVQRFTLPAREGKEWTAFLAQPDDKGPEPMQALLNDLLPRLKPSVVLMVGMCGGLNERNVKETDVIFARNVFGYGRQRHRGEDIHVTTKPYPVDARIVRAANQLRALGLPKDVSWSVKDFASANILLDDLTSTLRTKIMNISDDILGFEMEGTGFLHPNQESPAAISVPAGIIKGVSDFGDGQQQADKEKRQEAATRHAARVAFALLHETPQSLFMAETPG